MKIRNEGLRRIDKRGIYPTGCGWQCSQRRNIGCLPLNARALKPSDHAARQGGIPALSILPIPNPLGEKRANEQATRTAERGKKPSEIASIFKNVRCASGAINLAALEEPLSATSDIDRKRHRLLPRASSAIITVQIERPAGIDREHARPDVIDRFCVICTSRSRDK